MKLKQKKGVLNMAELNYIKVGDYLIPDLEMESEEDDRELGKYGLMRGKYLKKTNRGKYNSMLLMDKLWSHLLEVDETAQQYEDNLIEQMKKIEGVTEQLKADNQMEWVQKMNNIRQRAEEIVRQEMIYI